MNGVFSDYRICLLVLILDLCQGSFAIAADAQAQVKGKGESGRPLAAVSDTRPGQVFKDCAECPEMVIISAGRFEMGGNLHDFERPIHNVGIGSFAIGKTEVTQGQWKAVMGSKPSHFSDCGESCPVEQVNWNDAQEFIQKLNAKSGKRYRLPSEAEWEYACRAGGRHTWCGGDDTAAAGWYDGSSGGKTHPAGQRFANAWGLYDMSGNVWEWVADCWNANHNSAPTDGSVRTSGDCTLRVLRGGSWNVPQKLTRSSIRSRGVAINRYYGIGFRLVRILP